MTSTLPRLVRSLAAVGVAVSSCIVGAVAVAGPAVAAVAAVECNVKPGGEVTDFWAQQRLAVTRPWSLTRGAGVTVAVIDSGINPRQQPQLRGIRFAPGINLTADGQPRSNTRDCTGHGTGVTSVLAAQPSTTVAFTGIAPDVTVMPIKVANSEQDTSSTLVAAGIRAAVAAGVDVINISIAGPTNTAGLDDAVAEAARRNIVIVAAAGNDGANANLPAYPAALSTRYSNVIAVSALKQDDTIADFSETGNYVDLAAPGENVATCAGLTGYALQPGTSFAAPFVAGAAAMVRATLPDLTAAQVRDRLEQTADTPPATVPDRRYGYGVVNPYLAVTSVRAATAAVPTTAAAQPVPARRPAAAADRSAQHTALAIALSLFGLVAVVIAMAVVSRSRRNRPRSVVVG